MIVLRHGVIGFMLAAFAAGDLAAQRDRERTRRSDDPLVYIEARGSIAVPTFDIADRLEAGAGGGIGVGFQLLRGFWLLGDGDLTFHDGEGLTNGTPNPDVNVYHAMGKLGFEILSPDRSPLSILINAGAGAMRFDQKGGANETYFAVNAGLKITYEINRNAAVVVSPQGNVALIDEEGEDLLGTDQAWIWPFAVGFRLQF